MGTWSYPVLRPEPTQQLDPLGQMAKVAALRGAMQEQQLRNIQIQQAQYQWGETQALNQAFKQSYTVDPTSGVPQFDQQKMTAALGQSGYGSAIPGIVDAFTKMQQNLENVQKTKNDIDVQQRDALGQLGYAVHQAKDDPNMLISGLESVQKQYPQVGPYIQALQQDPTKAPQIVQWMMNQSPKVQEQVLNERKTAADEYKVVGDTLVHTPTGKVLAGDMMQLPQALANAAGIPQAGGQMFPADWIKKIKQGLAEGKEGVNFGGNFYMYDKATGEKTLLGPSTPMTMVTTMYGTPGVVPAGTTSPPGGAMPSGVAPPTGGGGALPQIPQVVQSPMLGQQQAQQQPPQTQQQTTPQGEQVPPDVQQWLTQHGITYHPGGAAAPPTGQAQPSAQPTPLTNQDAVAAVANVPLKYREDAIKSAQKSANEYANSAQATADIESFINLARRGNITAYQYEKAAGVLSINSQFGSVRINKQELDLYGGMPLWDRIEAWFGKNITGASIPPNILDDMDAVHGALAKNAFTKYQNDLNGINATVPGAAFKPAPMNTAPSVGPPPASLKGPIKPGEKQIYGPPGKPNLVWRGGKYVDPATGLPPQ